MKNYHKVLIVLSIFLIPITSTLASNVYEIKLPDVPKVEAVVPEPITLKVTGSTSKTNKEILEELNRDKSIKFSNHKAPVYYEHKEDSSKVAKVGEIFNGKVTAFLHTTYMEQNKVIDILQKAGFEILASLPIDKKGFATSIVFTNDEILKASTKINRGFASTLRVTIDKKNRLVSITNPIFFMNAFMQDDYDKKLALRTLSTLRDAFKDLKNSDEQLKFRILKRYQFMKGLPKYMDMTTIKKGNMHTLLQKARESNKVVYEKALSVDSTIIGVKLGSRTTKFVKKIGYQNAGLLPYPVLIEGGEVKILDPKYYIAIMYPMLKMSQFMTIATTPGAIHKDIDKIFR
ncbi:hypothetical protein GJV85_00845 [Sulfurimonas aquatica]|uniref:Uncharacterized protein n=1 Tax=Sulfurimonas aquatica TaxID=2672570 RepID=A0A975AY72_9BACT|nr:hypothetical protein [Sulfurimonas aquatica]QSZ40724.1 hypothetical protein GJV85_00845 [Sulfurimonas aquatica]